METNGTGEKSIEEMHEEMQEKILQYFRALAEFVGFVVGKEDEPEVVINEEDQSYCTVGTSKEVIAISRRRLFNQATLLEEAGHALRGWICKKILKEEAKPRETKLRKIQIATAEEVRQEMEEFHSKKEVERRKVRYVDTVQEGACEEFIGRLSVFIGLQHLREAMDPSRLCLEDGKWIRRATEARSSFQERVSWHKKVKDLWEATYKIEEITERREKAVWGNKWLGMLKTEVEKICRELLQFEASIARPREFNDMISKMKDLAGKLSKREKKEKVEEVVAQFKTNLPLYREEIARFLRISAQARGYDLEHDLDRIWHHLGYMAAEALAQKGDVEEIKAAFTMPNEEIIER